MGKIIQVNYAYNTAVSDSVLCICSTKLFIVFHSARSDTLIETTKKAVSAPCMGITLFVLNKLLILQSSLWPSSHREDIILENQFQVRIACRQVSDSGKPLRFSSGSRNKSQLKSYPKKP
jgi:hypothetical protein